MSDLRDLPDLARDVRERVVTPPYDEVSRRVWARRRRRATGTLAAAVLLAGGVAVWQNAVTTAGPLPHPAEPSPIPPTDASQWRPVVDGPQAHPFEVSGTDDGSIAVVWRALEPGAPTFALVIREADGSVHGTRLDNPVTLTPVPGGWVGITSARGFVIGSDGTWTDLGTPGDPRPPRPGDVVVHGQYGRWLYNPGDRTWQALGDDYGDFEGAYVTPDGVPVTCSSDGHGHVTITKRGVHSPWIRGDSCVMAGRGDAVSAVGLGDEADGSIPLTGLLVTAPGGTIVRGDFLTMTGVTSVTVTPAGSTLVTDAGTGDAFVLSADRTQVIEPDRKLGTAFVAGDRLYATTYGFMSGPLLFSDDDGRTWKETVLPGME